MNKFKFSERSERNLLGVNHNLIMVVRNALVITDTDFMVIEGVRTYQRQIELYEKRKTLTLKSRHLTGHAVDLAPLINNKIDWDDWESFNKLANVMKISANQIGISIIWGGDWKTFKDGPHFELQDK